MIGPGGIYNAVQEVLQGGPHVPRREGNKEAVEEQMSQRITRRQRCGCRKAPRMLPKC